MAAAVTSSIVPIALASFLMRPQKVFRVPQRVSSCWKELTRAVNSVMAVLTPLIWDSVLAIEAASSPIWVARTIVVTIPVTESILAPTKRYNWSVTAPTTASETWSNLVIQPNPRDDTWNYPKGWRQKLPKMLPSVSIMPMLLIQFIL